MGIFNMDLQTEVQPAQAVTSQATGTALGGLSNFLSSMGNLKAAKDAKAEAGKPTYTQLKDQQEQANLKNYSTSLADLTQQRDSGALTPQAYQLKLKALDQNFATQGIDVSSAAFGTARTSITGIPSANYGMTDDQILMGDLLKTPEGQGKLALANYTLEQELGKPPTQEQVANKVRADLAIEANFNNVVMRNKVELQQNLPIIQNQIASVANDFNTSISILEQNGVDLTPEMLQKTYINYRGFKASTLAKLPSDTPQDVKDNLFKLTDEFFTQYGMDKTDGVFKLESKDVLQLKYKAQLTVKALQERGNVADNLLALGIVKNGYAINPQDQAAIDLALSNIDLTPSTPDYITEAGIVLSNDLISTAQAISAPNVTFLRDAKGYTKAFREAIGQNAYDLNTKQTAAQGWSNFTSRATIIKGFNPADIASGKADPASVYTNIAGLATSIGTIDFQNEAASFEGVRSSVSSALAPMLDALEKVDPEKGKAARTLMFYSLGKAAAEYDAQIKSEEKALNIGFNAKTGAYEIDIATYAGNATDQVDMDSRQSLLSLISAKFGNDLTQAVTNGVTLTEADLKGLKGFENMTLSGAQEFVNFYMDGLPEATRLKRLLDLRNSRVYLDNVAGQVEPKSMKETRLNSADRIAADTKTTLEQIKASDGVGASASDLLRTFEGFRSKPYYDVNAYRVGYGSDTITKEDGTVVTVTKDMTVTEADAERDLARRTREFSLGAEKKIGPDNWAKLDNTSRAVLTSIAYNYGSIPDRLLTAARSGDKEALATAIEGLAGDNNGVNNSRRLREAAIVRGGVLPEKMGETTGTPLSTSTTPVETLMAPQAQAAAPVATSTAPQVGTPIAAPTGDVAALPEQVQAQQQPQGNEPKTAGNTPVDPNILDTIAALSQNANDVRVFDTNEEMVQAYNNQEVNLGSLVLINGKLMSVTSSMVK